MEDIVYRRGKVIFEVPDVCMIVFTSGAFYTGITVCDRKGGAYIRHFLMFAYIVEKIMYQ